MAYEQIPGLSNSLIFAGNSEVVLLEGKPIPGHFFAYFTFYEEVKEGKKRKPLSTWDIRYEISISENGTPVLLSVLVSGSFRVSVNVKITNEINNLDPDKFKPPSKNEILLEEPKKRNPNNRSSVQRWQLKVSEQYRFQLLELALFMAVTSVEQVTEDGVTWWRIKDQEFNSAEINKMRQGIAKRIRQRITPDLLAEVARIYNEAGLRGEKPIKAVEEFYGCSYRTAQDYATKARKHAEKFLPETTPGKITVSKPKERKGRK